MRTLAAVLLTGVIYAHAQPVYACHKYSRWYYPYPQRCGIYARASVPVRVLPSGVNPPVRPAPDLPLPDMSATWAGAMDTPAELELIEGMQRLKALRLLTQEGN